MAGHKEKFTEVHDAQAVSLKVLTYNSDEGVSVIDLSDDLTDAQLAQVANSFAFDDAVIPAEVLSELGVTANPGDIHYDANAYVAAVESDFGAARADALRVIKLIQDNTDLETGFDPISEDNIAAAENSHMTASPTAFDLASALERVIAQSDNKYAYEGHEDIIDVATNALGAINNANDIAHHAQGIEMGQRILQEKDLTPTEETMEHDGNLNNLPGSDL